MIKDKNSSNDIYKNYAFVEFFDLEDAKKALLALGKGEIKLREETLSGNYSTKTDDKNNDNNLNYIHGVNIINIIYNIYL
jgi:RNA recognition motif-containing protein